MNIMKTKIYGLIMLGLALAAGACNDWLDVAPGARVKDRELFSSEEGFKEALAGVYGLAVQEDLYGKELTFGMVGVMGQEWDYQSYEYDHVKSYAYDDLYATGRVERAWNGMYNAIANANKLLQELEGKEALFSGANHAIIRGEARALRAWLHFDLLRLFGASYEANAEKVAIPYVTRYTSLVYPQLTVSAVIDSVLVDLKAAADDLVVDPARTGQEVTVHDDNGYLVNRQVHLNYYAVRGLQARVYLYKKDYGQASEYAGEVIRSGKFAWVEQANLTNPATADLTFASEHLFALNAVKLKTVAENYFTPSGGSATFYITAGTRNLYYETATDYRYLYQFEMNANGTAVYPRKYYQLDGEAWNPAYRNKMPVLKLAEMYFILSECRYHTSGDALEPLNEVRTRRGVGPLQASDLANYETVLLSEYRKEFLGEGQLFFFYKRLNRSRVERSTLDPMPAKGYILPMPVSEYESANRVDNQ
jgi:hypothetical protein